MTFCHRAEKEIRLSVRQRNAWKWFHLANYGVFSIKIFAVWLNEVMPVDMMAFKPIALHLNSKVKV